MIAYTGRLGFTKFNPNKPIRQGIKVWMRADPHNGFVDDFQIYTGRENNVREIGLGERVVKDLTRDIWGNNHHVYCDNYFTSVKSFKDLLENGMWYYTNESQGYITCRKQIEPENARRV